MIRIHPRSSIVSKADADFSLLMIEFEQKHEMTYADLFDMISIFSSALADGMRRELDVHAALTDLSVPTHAKAPRASRLHKFHDQLAALDAKHALTYGEWFSILSCRIGEYAKSLIRHERHPNDRTKYGDEA